jgi:hypothetical protein
MECPGCGVWVYLSPMDGWRNDAYGYTCEPPSTTHSQHIVPGLIIEYKADLRAKVEALRDEAEYWVAIGAYDRVLNLLDGSSDD